MTDPVKEQARIAYDKLVSWGRRRHEAIEIIEDALRAVADSATAAERERSDERVEATQARLTAMLEITGWDEEMLTQEIRKRGGGE